MNEKLFDIASELSKQASDWVDETYLHSGYHPWQNHYRTKFAELIVQECANICGGGSLDAKLIKEHFGVE